MQEQNIYVAIDLKSFYASVECQERGLNPLTTNLVVADSSRTEKTICLAVSPSLKQYGIPGRARLFEVVQKVREINTNRKYVLSKSRKEVLVHEICILSPQMAYLFSCLLFYCFSHCSFCQHLQTGGRCQPYSPLCAAFSHFSGKQFKNGPGIKIKSPGPGSFLYP